MHGLVLCSSLRSAPEAAGGRWLTELRGQATARDHARALSEMADTAARDSAKCQSSGAALGSQAYKKCRALLEDKMSIEKDVPPDRGYSRANR
jgi:hypothetical protein